MSTPTVAVCPSGRLASVAAIPARPTWRSTRVGPIPRWRPIDGICQRQPSVVPRRMAVAVAAPARQVEQREEEGTGDEKFVWEKHWYPIAPLKWLEEAQGEGFESGLPQIQRQTILGRDIVVWKDAEGEWRAVEDRCSHRLAALSLGSVQKDGTLACRYHGWCFNGHGECTHIPQATDAASEATACSSSRSKVVAFPTLEAGGLLWVWPDDCPTSWVDCAAAKPQMGKFTKQDANWVVTDVPLSYKVMMENGFDPSHVSHAHHGQLAFGAKFSPEEDLTINEFKQTRKTTADGGFEVSHSPVTADTQGRNAVVDFHPPNLITTEALIKGILNLKLGVHHVPMRPGVTRVIFALDFEAKEDKDKAALKIVMAIQKLQTFFRELPLMLFPGYVRGALRHVCGGGVGPARALLLQDITLMHSEDAQLARSKAEWANQYYLASASDNGVAAFRKWLHTLAGGGPTWFSRGTEEEAMTGKKAEVYDAWNRHSRRCPECRKALKFLGGLENLMREMAVGLLGVAVALAVSRIVDVRMAVFAIVAAGAALLACLEAQKLSHKLVTDLPSSGMPEFSYQWPS
ncbi:unnamed protein product [Ostreobium quekettii]|uniref:Rieske domain-containing protein n=1 Tax=Ostreobium quekettii TaxID=121088 RepID=A0A8S1IWZ1_9CHLO|nr:unnamed protein product [Ostreobium quekettii]|eukprot:evm.model.scf_810.6 EVM.evm.TU.scf_810.6   scf_810:50642-55765(-)